MNMFYIVSKNSNECILNNIDIFGKKSNEIIENLLNGLNIKSLNSHEIDDKINLESLNNTKFSNEDILFIVDESAILLEESDYTSLANLCNDKATSVLMDSNKKSPVVIACNVLFLIKLLSEYNLKSVSISELYNLLIKSNTNILYYESNGLNNLLVQTSKSFIKAYKIIQDRIIIKHMNNNVIFINPDTCFIDFDVKIDSNCIIYPGNIIKGTTNIASACTLYPNNRIVNANIGNSNTIDSSVLLECKIGNNNTVGPFAYIRPSSKIADNCRIGDFVEIKNSSIDDGTKVSHLTYVGDSDLGKNINLGCGVVFVNYDGKIKQRSKIEDNAFIGCNTNIIAPVTVEKNAYVAAGSTITENVPKDSLHISRCRAVIKENWAKKRREDGRLK